MSAKLVFGCDDLRKNILSFLPKRCLYCHNKITNNKTSYPKYYKDKEWCYSENIKLSNCCNWCYFYVFEYQ